ncbi:MAG: PilW family protein [Alcanivorax sp.]|nr:PilW family protein [Alcanivorax sp.]
MNAVKRHKKQRGLGLVEIMVAMLVSALLVAGVVRIFVSNKETYVIQDQMSRLQEDGRFGFQFLMKDIRMAGYFGCGRNHKVQNNLNGNTSFAYNFGGAPVVGYHAQNGAWTPTLDPYISNLNPDTGSDILVIRRADSASVNLRPPYADKNNPATTLVEKNHDFDAGQIVAVSDCTNVTIVQVTGVSSGNSSVTHNTGAQTPGNSDKSLGHNYGEGATISQMVLSVYYIKTGTDGPALFRKIEGKDPEELISGVQEMRFSYGLDTNGDGLLDTYSDTLDVTQQSQVISIRVSLLLRGDQTSVVKDPQGLVFNGKMITNNDGRLRYVMSSTATLRNRVP